MTLLAPNIRASGSSFAQLQASGLTGELERLITANSTATAAPTVAPTVSTNGGGTYGGLLAPGNYLCTCTEVNGVGETTASPESSSFTATVQSNPSVAMTVNPTGGGASGGALAAGTYFGYYTWVDAVNGGETTVGSSVSSQFTVAAGDKPQATLPSLPAWAASANIYLTPANGSAGTEVLYLTGVTGTTANLYTAAPGGVAPPSTNGTSTNIPTITFPTLKTGNTGRNLYLTPAGGGTGTEVQYATAITTGTYNASAAVVTTNPAAPTANTTAISAAAISRVRSGEQSRLEHLWYKSQIATDNFIHAAPIATSDITQQLVDNSVAAALLATAIAEVTALIVANPGSLHQYTDPTGFVRTHRTWP